MNASAWLRNAHLRSWGAFFVSVRKHCMPTAKKEASIVELRERLTNAKALFFTDFTGMTVAEFTRLRNDLRKDGSCYAVVKNTLFSIAAGEEIAKQFEAHFAGPTAVVFAAEDPVAPAKALKKFTDDAKKLSVKAAYVDGKYVGAAEVAALASMPPKIELQGMLLGLLASPLRNFASVLAANPSGFVRVLSAREKQLVESAS